ncbi:MAG: hypothetical protein LBO73_04560 [Holosporaceae bacterium]|jgi:RecB family endonuclease NucS|nr:hypothetical protein [Holosporaceae bacterium]
MNNAKHIVLPKDIFHVPDSVKELNQTELILKESEDFYLKGDFEKSAEKFLEALGNENEEPGGKFFIDVVSFLKRKEVVSIELKNMYAPVYNITPKARKVLKKLSLEKLKQQLQEKKSEATIAS